MKVIGITGGVGAGKSAILNYIEENYKAKLLRADDIAHELMEPGRTCNAAIADIFPIAVDEKGYIKRAELAQIIFEDAKNRNLVNSIVHPEVKRFILDAIKQCQNNEEYDFVVVEAALLLEDNYNAFCDEVWYVYASEDTRRARLKENRGYSDEKIDGIFSSQMEERDFRKLCDRTIENDASMEEALSQLKEYMDSFGGKEEMEMTQEKADEVVMSKYIFGLDIGTRNVVGTVAYKEDEDDKLHVVAMCCKEHETRAMLDGQIHDINKVGKTVAAVRDELQKMVDEPLNEVCIAAAGRVLKTIQTTAVMEFPEETIITGEHIHSLDLYGIEQAQREIVEKNDTKFKFYCVGYTVMRYYLNDDIMSNLEGHKTTKISEDIIVTFLPEDVVDGLYSAVGRAGLKVLNLTLEPIAAINVAIPENFRMLNLGLVDVGAGTSDICITKDGSITAYGMIPHAGDELTEVIVQHYLVDFNTAERIKLASGKEDTITYEDILCLSHDIQPEEVWDVTDKTVENIANEVAAKIIELNGGSPVSAVFVVGGGGKIHGFTDKIADRLGIQRERVALRGEQVLGQIDFFQEDVEKDPLIITPIGICLNYYEQKNSFIFVRFNGERIKLYNNNKLTVVDAAVEAGFANEDLFPKRGPELTFFVNDKQRIVRGDVGESAVITIDGEEVSLNAEITNNSIIEITPSTVGAAATYTIEDLDEYKSTVTFMVNGQKVLCPRFAEVNGQLQPPSYSIQSGDIINMRGYYTVQQIIDFMDITVNMNSVIYVNNQSVDENALVYENFSVELHILEGAIPENIIVEDAEEDYAVNFAENAAGEAVEEGEGQQAEEKETAAANEASNEVTEESEEAPKKKEGFDGSEVWQPSGPVFKDINSITVTVNGLNYTLRGKTQFNFVDIFDYYHFDLTQSKGRAVLTKINDVECGYTDPIKSGDQIYVGWVE